MHFKTVWGYWQGIRCAQLMSTRSADGGRRRAYVRIFQRGTWTVRLRQRDSGIAVTTTCLMPFEMLVGCCCIANLQTHQQTKCTKIGPAVANLQNHPFAHSTKKIKLNWILSGAGNRQIKHKPAAQIKIKKALSTPVFFAGERPLTVHAAYD